MRKIVLFLLIGLMSLLFAGVGKITGVKGEARIERLGKVVKVLNGTVVEEKDVIKTVADGRVKITFNDHTVISLGKEARFSVDEYVNVNEKNPKAKFSIVKGAFKAISGQIGKVARDKFTVKTRNATIGIRGTIFHGHIYPKQNKEQIACTKGGITVTSGGQSVNVDAGNYVTVENGQAGDVKPLTKEVEEEVSTGDGGNNKDTKKEEKSDAGKKESGDAADNGDNKQESADSSASTDDTSSQSSGDETGTESSTFSSSSGASTDGVSELASSVATDATDSTKTDTSLASNPTSLSGYHLQGYSSETTSDNFIASGASSYNYNTTSLYSANYALTQNLQSTSSTGTTTMNDNFAHTPSTPVSIGGYTGFSQISTSNPLSYSFTTQYGDSITGDYTLYMDNMGEFLVGYSNESTGYSFYYDMFYAGSKSDATKLDTSKYYVYNDFKGISLVMNADDTLYDIKFDTIKASYNHIYLNSKLKVIVPENQYTDDFGGSDFISMHVADDGTISGKNYYKDYDSVQQIITTSAGDVVDGALYGTDFQGAGVSFEDKKYQDYGTGTQSLLSTDYNAHAVNLVGTINLPTEYIGTNSMDGYLVYATDGALSNANVGSITGATINSATGAVSFGTISAGVDLTMTASGTIAGNSSYYLNEDVYGSMINSGSATLSGYTYNYIQNSGWFVSRADKYDSVNDKFIENNDDYSSWGYWTADFTDGTTVKNVDMRSTWVIGDKTNAADLNALASLVGNGGQATYNGHVLGVANDGTNSYSIKLNSLNQVQMAFDFGAGTAAVNQFQYQVNTGSDASPNLVTINNTGVTIDTITQNGFLLKQAALQVGQGTYFGPAAQSVGGEIHALQDSTQTYTTNGVFKAAR
jgi:hypothetical protein